MPKIAIVCDSTCDLLDEVITKYNIKILPLRIIYSNKEFRDKIDISPEEIYSRFNEEIPSTSLPSPEDVTNLFKDLENEGYTHVIVTLISSGLSGTMNMIRNIIDNFNNMVFEIVDSKSLSMGLGIPVLEGAKELEKTNDFNKTIKKIKDVVKKTEIYYVVKTLEYLRKGGRIGKVEGAIGDLLSIKPIISINEDGVYYSYKKVRGRKKSLNELYEIVEERSKEENLKVVVAHGDAYDEAQNLLNKIKNLSNVKETLLTQISPVLVVHTGPGLIGVIISESLD